MKKTENKDASKKAFTIGSLIILCIAILLGAYFLTKEPETDFEPAPAVTESSTNTWEEQTKPETAESALKDSSESQTIGNATDDTQTIVEETENHTTTNLSDSTKKSESTEAKPTEKPVITKDTSNPEKQPEYSTDVPQVSETKPEPQPAPSDNGSNSSGHVYDPVFGWIDTGSTHQDTVDSSGSINKQIGSMN